MRNHLVVAALIIAGGVALLATTSVGALNVASSTSFVTLLQDQIVSDADVRITLQGHISQGGNRAANATVCPGVEANRNNPIARDDLLAGNLVYGIQLEESVSNSWDATRIYKVELFGDGALISTLYFQNARANSNRVEGVRIRGDLGSPNPAINEYSTVVTRVVGVCP